MANIREVLQQRITRRGLLGGGIGAATLLTGCGVIKGAGQDINDSRKAVGDWIAGKAPSNDGQAATSEKNNQTDVDAAAKKAVATAFAERGFPSPSLEGLNFVERGGIKVANVPDKPNGTVDIAKGGFKNTVGVLTHIVAEPGVLHVGPDHYVRPGGLEASDKSGGSIQPFNPLNQEGVRWYGGGEQRLPEGGFVFMTGAKMVFRVGPYVFDLPYKGEGHNYFVYIRGRYGDNRQDTDKNLNVELLPGSYRVGNIQLREYSARRESNAAFVSEGQFLQEVTTSHSSGGNSGDGGASKLTIIGFDYNTAALEVATHVQGRNQDPKKVSFKSEYKNF